MYQDLVNGPGPDLVGGPGPDLVGARIVPHGPQRSRRLICGATPTSVANSATADISIQPQDLFRTDRIIVPSDIAFSFIFTDIKVGQRSQLVAAASLPCGAFTEVAVDCYVTFDTAAVGNLIVLSVQNLDTVNTITFRAMLLGRAAV